MVGVAAAKKIRANAEIQSEEVLTTELVNVENVKTEISSTDTTSSQISTLGDENEVSSSNEPSKENLSGS